MHVLCFGAGAIGSLVGARLSLSGVAVTLLGRRAHVAAIRTHGLVLETPRERLTAKQVDSVTALEDLSSPPDLVLLTVKAYDTREALQALRPALQGGARMMSLQNGIGNEELIEAAVGPERTVAGSITINTSQPRPGVVRQNTEAGGLGVAPLDRRQDPADLVALFRGAGIRTESYPDYRAMKWSKLLLNIFTNATSAILDLSPAAIIGDPALFDVEREAFREARQVIGALGLRPLPLPGYPIPWLAAFVAVPPWAARPVLLRYIRRARGEGGRPSLWHDVRRGRAQTEVDVLNGAVAREGRRLGVAVPVNAVLTEVVEGIAAGRLNPAEFRGRPQALLALLDERRK